MDSPFEHRVEAACPACGSTGLLMTAVPIDIPWFGDAIENVLRCPACGFRHADFMIAGQRPPARFTIPIRPDTMGARVVRASSGTWRIPELGLLAEPTPRSESFVTNVEGMLDRARDILLTARQISLDDETKVVIAERLLERVDRIADGLEAATLVVEDPFGNSAIAHDEARREELTEEEAATLATGYLVFDREDLGV